MAIYCNHSELLFVIIKEFWSSTILYYSLDTGIRMNDTLHTDKSTERIESKAVPEISHHIKLCHSFHMNTQVCILNVYNAAICQKIGCYSKLAVEDLRSKAS